MENKNTQEALFSNYKELHSNAIFSELMDPGRYYNIHTDQIEYSTTKKVVVFTPNKVLYNQLLKN